MNDRWICQLGDGFMLKECCGRLAVERTGYPYPDTGSPQRDLLYSLYRSAGFDIDRAAFEDGYSGIIENIVGCFNELGVHGWLPVRQVFRWGMSLDARCIHWDGKVALYAVDEWQVGSVSGAAKMVLLNEGNGGLYVVPGRSCQSTGIIL